MEQPHLKMIEEIAGGDLDFQNEILTILKKEFSVEAGNYVDNYLAKNYIEASKNVHKLKHKISLLGLEEGLALAASFEKQLKDNNTELHQNFIQLLDKINVYLYS